MTRANEIAQIMTNVRLEAGLTQEELAKLMRTSQSTIARMESGRFKPRLTTLEMLAEITGKRLEIRFV